MFATFAYRRSGLASLARVVDAVAVDLRAYEVVEEHESQLQHSAVELQQAVVLLRESSAVLQIHFASVAVASYECP